MIKDLPELRKIILNNYKMNKTNITHDTIIKLNNWKLGFTENDMINLAKEGENEMIDLEVRYQSRFPTIMPETYNKKSYKVFILCIYICDFYVIFNIFLIISFVVEIYCNAKNRRKC